jgi:hypothetical protein
LRSRQSVINGASAPPLTLTNGVHEPHDRHLDLGDFLGAYVVDAKLRNDLALHFLVGLDGIRLEAIPLKLECAHTRLTERADFAWVRRRFREACAPFGTEVAEEDCRLAARWRPPLASRWG